jgi:hypothetical protein
MIVRGLPGARRRRGWRTVLDRTTLKSSIMASRAVDSQQTLVFVPAMRSVSIPRLRRVSSKDEEPGMRAL